MQSRTSPEPQNVRSCGFVFPGLWITITGAGWEKIRFRRGGEKISCGLPTQRILIFFTSSALFCCSPPTPLPFFQIDEIPIGLLSRFLKKLFLDFLLSPSMAIKKRGKIKVCSSCFVRDVEWQDEVENSLLSCSF